MAHPRISLQEDPIQHHLLSKQSHQKLADLLRIDLLQLRLHAQYGSQARDQDSSRPYKSQVP